MRPKSLVWLSLSMKIMPSIRLSLLLAMKLSEYFRVLLKALALIRPEIAAKMKHLSHGMVRVARGKDEQPDGECEDRRVAA